jgi:rRNA maturation RNase YbeY
LAIHFNCLNISFTLKNKKRIKAWLCNTIQEEKRKNGIINIILTSDADILDINNKYLSHNYFTDVITFDYSSDNILSGDIFISIPTVSENAKIYNTTFENELMRVFIHGILHLIGYKDKSDLDQHEMRAKENYYLNKLFTS